jgi:hypothetical protein
MITLSRIKKGKKKTKEKEKKVKMINGVKGALKCPRFQFGAESPAKKMEKHSRASIFANL